MKYPFRFKSGCRISPPESQAFLLFAQLHLGDFEVRDWVGKCFSQVGFCRDCILPTSGSGPQCSLSAGCCKSTLDLTTRPLLNSRSTQYIEGELSFHD